MENPQTTTAVIWRVHSEQGATLKGWLCIISLNPLNPQCRRLLLLTPILQSRKLPLLIKEETCSRSQNCGGPWFKCALTVSKAYSLMYLLDGSDPPVLLTGHCPELFIHVTDRGHKQFFSCSPFTPLFCSQRAKSHMHKGHRWDLWVKVGFVQKKSMKETQTDSKRMGPVDKWGWMCVFVRLHSGRPVGWR